MDIEKVKREIEQLFGITFSRGKFYDYEYFNKEVEASISLGKYTCYDKLDQPFIGLDIMNKKSSSGQGCPCDSEQEAIELAKEAWPSYGLPLAKTVQLSWC